jgi:DNA-binding Lrp family transcriptional regulator
VGKYQNIIPHQDVIITLSRSKSPTEVTLRATEWAVITQVDGQKTIGQIAKILALTEDEALEMFYGLYQKGLIEIVSTDIHKDAIVSGKFFQRMLDELTKIIGPVAPFVLEEALWEINAAKESFRTERVPELVEILSDEITDSQKKVRFQQVMLELIRELN